MGIDGFGFPWGAHFVGVLFVGFSILFWVAIIAVLVLLVRFLIIGTRAAQLYVRSHGAAGPQHPAATHPAQHPAPPPADRPEQSGRPTPPTPAPAPATAPAPEPRYPEGTTREMPLPEQGTER